MRQLSDWLKSYGESHQHPVNQKIHHVAVPGVFLSAIGLVWSIPALTLNGVIINWVWVAIIPVLVFYFRLSLSVFLMMLGFTLACIALVWSCDLLQLPVFAMSASAFVVLWVCLLIGHKLEGKKPSFFDDLLFLLIGPIWIFRK